MGPVKVIVFAGTNGLLLRPASLGVGPLSACGGGQAAKSLHPPLKHNPFLPRFVHYYLAI